MQTRNVYLRDLWFFFDVFKGRRSKIDICCFYSPITSLFHYLYQKQSKGARNTKQKKMTCVFISSEGKLLLYLQTSHYFRSNWLYLMHTTAFVLFCFFFNQV